MSAPARPPFARVLPLLVVGLAGAFALRRLDNTDTWWHLAAGRWIVAHRTVPATDPLSWTVPDHVWVNVQWLFDVVIYALHELGGPSLLVATSALAYAAATALMLVNVERYVGPIAAAALGGWATLVSQERFAIRPEMVSYLLLQVMLWLYATGRVAGARRLWLLPLVMCVWANCHSLFIVGAVVIVCHMVGSLVTDLPMLPAGWRRPLEPGVRTVVLGSGVAALAATAVNPFGLTGATFPLVLMSRINGDHPVFRTIGELRRPFEGYFVTLSITAYQALFFFGITVVGLALVVAALQRPAPVARGGAGAARAARRRTGAPPPPPRAAETPPRPLVHVDLADVAAFAGVAYLSLLARRNMALFAMGGAPCIAACLALLAARLPDTTRATLPMLERAAGAVLALVLVAGGWFVASNGFYRWNGELHEFGLGTLDVMFPTRAAEFVRAQGLPPPLFNDFTNGGYLSWAEPIPGGVYIDGRTEVYDVEFLGPYMDQLKSPPAWQAEMDRRGIQTVVFFHWWPNHQVLLHYLVHDPRWALVYYDETSVILVRRAGNEDVIARATAAFPSERERTERLLLEPGPSWQWQVGRVRGLSTYGSLLGVMGRGSESQPFAARMGALSSGR